MNQGLYRVVFNAARGLRMVVQETATATGKGASKATAVMASGALAGAAAFAPMLIGAALAGMLTAPCAHAQIVANPMAPGGQRPTILVAPNGIPIVNITTPSAAGVSRNLYNQFDVSGRGAIVNNSRNNVQSGIGGWINGNPFLARGPARVILNEVNSSNPSYINGPVEIAGQRAEFILANPSGISVSGGIFINSNRVTLTTGTPQFNAFGGLDSYVVRGGTVSINGAGLDLSKTDYAAILARAVQVNAAIYATDLKVVTGANQINADHTQITPTTGTGAAPTFALDVAALGGMFANHIFLTGTEQGLGVRNAGSIGASNGDLIVTAAGRLENTGTLEGTRVELASAGDIDNRNGTIRQTSSVGLTIIAPVLSNTNGGIISAEPVSAPTAGTAGGTNTGGGASTSGTTNPSTPAPGTGSGAGSGSSGTASSAPAPFVPTSPGTVTAAGTLRNDGGKIFAGGPITLQTPQISNAGGTLNVATMAVTGLNFSNAGGTLNVSQSFSANVGQLDNTGGKFNAGSLNIASSGDLINTDGMLTSATDASLTVGGKIENTRGSISASGALTANVAGATINNSGTLASNQALTLKADSLQNTQGSLQSAQAGVQLGVTNLLTNGNGGSINAAIDLSIQAGLLANGGSLRGGNDATVAVGGALTNDSSITAGRNTAIAAGSVQSSSSGVLGAGIQSDGKLGGVGDLRVTASGALIANGTNLAAGNATLQGQSVDLSGKQTSAASIAITATQGNVTSSKATIVTPGTLAVTANSNAAQTLVNDAGQLNAGQLQIKVSNLANTNGGEVVQTGTGATTIATSGTLSNDGGRIASNGQDLTLQGASITNASGKIEHAGTGTLNITGGSYSGTDGQITTNNALIVAMSGAFNQDGGKATTSAKHITIDAGSLSNRGGQLVQTGQEATRINVVGVADNTSGTIASNGNMTIAAGSLINQGGIVRAAGTSNLDVNVDGLLDNSKKGEVGASGNATITVKNKTGSLNNDTGSITAAGDLNASIAGEATNKSGTLAAKGHTTLSAKTLDNSQGTVAAVTGDLHVTTAGATINSQGGMQAAGTTTLINGGLVNDAGKVIGNTVVIDAGNKVVSNDHGTLDSATTLDIRSGALDNNAGLIQSKDAMGIDTHGQKLTNTRSPAPEKKQGEIVSGGALTLRAGALDNTGGYIGSKGLFDARTDKFTNAGGTVIAQANATIDTRGADYDNSAGKTMAVGELGINAGNLTNTGGLIRSTAKTTLKASRIANNSTLDNDQGIEGKNIVIGAGNLDNTSGAIRADVDVTITSGGAVDNSKGLISAMNELAIKDPNAIANSGAKTLELTNTNGTLVADKSLKIDAAIFSGDGKAVSGQDLSIALTQNIVNNGEVAANGNLTYATTGNFTNNGKLLAGQTLTVDGNNVDNNANAEMSGTDTTVNASGTLTNRGLIDSKGKTQINVRATGKLDNLGTGRIYGNAISIAASTLNNDADPANSTKSGTIAARDTLDIGADIINNQEHALIFSGGLGAKSMNIGAALDANRKATGQGSVLNNLSADIESLGGMSILMAQINNKDTHVRPGPQVTTSLVYDTINIEGVGIFAPKDVIATQGQTYVRARNSDGSPGAVLNPGGNVWGTWKHITATTADTVVDAAPARIVAGGDMNVDGRLYNENSKVLAGGAINANNYVAGPQPTGQSTALDVANVYDRFGKFQETVTLPLPPKPISLGGYEYKSNLNATKGYNAGAAPIGSANANAGAAGGVNGAGGADVIVQVPANVGKVIQTSGTAADRASGASGASGAGGASASQTIPMVVRTSTPSTRIPQASLFNLNGGSGGRYLIETDPRFANYRNWLSSDYLLNNLGLDPNNTLKRLGDGFYEQKLIREQVAQLTGYRYLEGFNNDDDQYAGLMNAGATFAGQYGLRPGVALSAAQMAQLTSDIVWLVEQTVTLPDGGTQRVLVPQVYVRVQPGDIDGSGALLSADATVIKSSGDIVNAGTIAGRTLVSINAENVNNLGGRIAGGSIGVNARNDLNNIGGSITARDAAVLTAGRDINIRTTTQSASGAGGLVSSTTIDRVAGVYVTNPGGTLIASAGRDVNLIGAALVSGGSAAVGAGRDINLGTVTESSAMTYTGKQTSVAASQSREVGSQISGGDAVILDATRDVLVRGSAINAQGDLIVQARTGNVTIEASRATDAVDSTSSRKKKGFLSSKTSVQRDSLRKDTSIGSVLGGRNIVVSGQDVTVSGSEVIADKNAALIAKRNLTIEAAQDTRSESSYRSTSKSGLMGSGGFGFTIGSRSQSTDSKTDSTSAARSTVGSIGGNTTLIAGNQYTQIGSDVLAPGGDVNIAAKKVAIVEARESRETRTEEKTEQSGLTIAFSNPVVSAVQGAMNTADTAKATATTSNSRMQALGAAVTALNTYNTANNIAAIAQNPAAATSVGIMINIGSSQSQKKSTDSADTGRGSSVTAGGNVNISAEGAGKQSELLIRGSDITAGDTAKLHSDGNMRLESAQDKIEQHSTNNASSASVGVAFTVGAQTGLSFNASASQARGKEDGSDVIQRNTHIRAGKQAEISSGGDTTLAGAVIQAERVKAKVEGDLKIESRQDTSTFDGKQTSAGGGISLCLPPICAGASSVSASGGKSTIKSNYASVAEQSGIRAGDGGFDVEVKGNTDLKGGAITSTQKAVDDKLNSFKTANLTTSDIENKADYKGDSMRLSGGYSTAAHDKEGNVLKDEKGRTLQPASSGGSAGVGSDKGNAGSTTKAAISGVAGNTEARTGDAETGIKPIFDKEKVRKELDAQMLITQQALPILASEIGTRMGKQAYGLRVQADLAEQAGDAAQAQALRNEAARYEEGGAYRIAAHALLGALGGGLSGAVGAGVGAGTVPTIADAIGKIDAPEAVKTLLVAAADTAVGTLAASALGGSATVGAVAAGNQVVNNFLTHKQVDDLGKELKACTTDACKKDVSKRYSELDFAQEKKLDACRTTKCANDLLGDLVDRPDIPYVKVLELQALGLSNDVAQRLIAYQGKDTLFTPGSPFQQRLETAQAGIDYCQSHGQSEGCFAKGVTLRFAAEASSTLAYGVLGAGAVGGKGPTAAVRESEGAANGGSGTKLPTATDATATSPYSSNGATYGRTTPKDINGNAIPTQPSLPSAGVKGGVAGAAEDAATVVTRPSGGAAAQTLGATREQAVADAVGGTRSGEIIKTTRGRTDVDVIDPAGNLIAVGGPAKADNLGNFVRGLMVYSETATARGVNAYFYYAPGTPQTVIDAATKVLGPGFVKPIP